MLRIAATAALVSALAVAGPVLAEDDPNCPAGTEPTPVTTLVHDNHEVAGETVAEILHDVVEPVTCA